MRILFVGPPLYGLLYPVLSLAQAFRVNGHEVLRWKICTESSRSWVGGI